MFTTVFFPFRGKREEVRGKKKKKQEVRRNKKKEAKEGGVPTLKTKHFSTYRGCNRRLQNGNRNFFGQLKTFERAGFFVEKSVENVKNPCFSTANGVENFKTFNICTFFDTVCF